MSRTRSLSVGPAVMVEGASSKLSGSASPGTWLRDRASEVPKGLGTVSSSVGAIARNGLKRRRRRGIVPRVAKLVERGGAIGGVAAGTVALIRGLRSRGED